MEQSKELLQMITDGIGYRNPQYYGSNITDCKQVLKYEIMELENVDILYDSYYQFVIENATTQIPSMTIAELENAYNNYDENTIDIALEEITNSIGQLLRDDNPQVLWLATKEAVENLYEGTIYIEAYSVEEGICIVDLGYDGCLFAFPQHAITRW